jgi:ADP-ribose pyrophosphatase
MSETQIGTKRIYEGRVINLRVDTVRFEDGTEGKREVIEHNGAVAIVALTDANEVKLVTQFRTPTGKELLEIPAGSINTGEDPLTCAHREIVEEISLAAAKMERLFAMYVAPGYSSEKITMFLATELSPQFAKGDEDEFIKVSTVPIDDALGMIDRGEIEDAKSIAGLFAVARRLGASQEKP